MDQSQNRGEPRASQKGKKTNVESELEPRPRYAAAAYHPADKLRDKVAVVTGGDSGIGRAVAVLYAREGADVSVVYANEDKDAEETKRAVEANGRRCLLFKGDVGDPQFAELVADQTVGQLGRLDVLVNNAAYQKHVSSLEELSNEQIEQTFRTNVFGYFNFAKACVPRMKPGSAIIASGSETGLFGNKGLLDYSSTKGAIHALTRSLASQLVDRGIRVNCVAPGPVWTPLNPADPGVPPEGVAHFGEKTEMGRAAQPEEIAPAYVFFASEADSSYVTGQVLPELGGVSP